MESKDFTRYDIKPKYFTEYLRNHGEHFNKQLLEFALSKLKVKDNIKLYSIEEVNKLLEINKVELKNSDSLYDYVYIANCAKIKLLSSSIVDERHIALYVKDIIDDENGYDGKIFSNWYCDMCKKGIAIKWDIMI